MPTPIKVRHFKKKKNNRQNGNLEQTEINDITSILQQQNNWKDSRSQNIVNHIPV